MNQKFYEKDWFLWASLILFAPVGIFLLWKNKKFNKNIGSSNLMVETNITNSKNEGIH